MKGSWMFPLWHSRQQISTQWALIKGMFHFPLLQIFFLSRKDEMSIGKRSWAVGDGDHGLSLKQKAINLFSIPLLFSWPFPHLCNAKPRICWSMLQSLFSTLCFNTRLNLMCFQSRPPQLWVNSSQATFWNLPSQCCMGRLRSLHSH